MKKNLYTIAIFTKLNTKRFFRDRLALFFGIAFPVIFLFVFGGISGGGNDVSFNVALINQSQQEAASQIERQIRGSEVFEVDDNALTLTDANEKLVRSEIDSIIVLPENFGVEQDGLPAGVAEVRFAQNNAQAGQAITAVLENQFRGLNQDIAPSVTPFTVEGRQSGQESLKPFDYVFAGLLGFSIIGLGIFGPINVFPELKKQGILRRLHTTPLKVWQYFIATMFSQALIGLVSLAVMFAVAILVFDLNVVGNYLEIIIFIILSIITILGIGLAIGGWAKNERQAAPLSNIIVFPMLFLSGTFFPRFVMPEWLQTVSAFLPLTPVIDGLRLLTTEGKHLVDLGAQLGLMAIWIILIYLLAFKLFRWE